MDTKSFHPHAGSYRIDTVIIGLYGHLGTFAGNAGNPLDGDQSVGNLGYLLFEQAFEEYRGCA